MSPKTAPTRRRRLLISAAVLVFATAAITAAAGDFDARIAHNQGFEAPVAPAQRTAAEALGGPRLNLAVSYDAATGAARTVANRVGYLSAPGAGEPLAIGLDFARMHLDLLGLSEADLDDLEVTDSVYSAVTGATHVYLRQRHQGLSVYNAQLHFNVSANGRLISLNNSFLPDLAQSVNVGAPAITAVDAVAAAAGHLEMPLAAAPEVLASGADDRRPTVLRVPELSIQDVEARLMWLPIRRGMARLVWSFQLHLPDQTHIYDLNVDAQTAQVWTRFDWVDADTYRAFEAPVESPIHSASPPPADGRTVAANIADATASPLGWHDDGTTQYMIPRGNNVHAYDDLDGNNAPPAVEPDCGPMLDCDFHFPIDFGTADPTDYTSAAVTNLFYWTNLVHDVQYHYGFDEAAGNFQVDNFGNGGLGGDDVRALSQKSGAPCPNNAFFSTPPDGSRPQQIMCLWTLSSPRRDFSWDTGVIVHEYGHGMSNRMVGGPSNVNCLNNLQQPGEGLSDWWGLVHTHEMGDQGTDTRGAGAYILGQAPDGPGVRPLPYSTDPAVNNWTYASVAGMGVPHGVGAVWAQAAWRVYWALVDFYGFDPDLYDAMGGSGNQRMMLYLNEGLKNASCSPAFTDIRDGIIQAAVDNYSGDDVCLLWEAFAAFGLGSDAISSGSNGLSPTDGFEIPPECLGSVFSDGFESGNTSAWSITVP